MKKKEDPKKPPLMIEEGEEQRNPLNQLIDKVNVILTKMEKASKNEEESSHHNRRTIDTKKHLAEKQIDDFEQDYKGLIITKTAETALFDLKKKIREAYENAYKEQAKTQVDKILEEIRKVTTIEALEKAKEAAREEVRRANKKIKMTPRKDLTNLRTKIEEHYEIRWLEKKYFQSKIVGLILDMRKVATATDNLKDRIKAMGTIINTLNTHVTNFIRKIKTPAGKEKLNLIKDGVEEDTEEAIRKVGDRENKKTLITMDTISQNYQEKNLDNIKNNAEKLIASLERLMKKLTYPRKPEPRFDNLLRAIRTKYEEVKTAAEKKL